MIYSLTQDMQSTITTKSNNTTILEDETVGLKEEEQNQLSPYTILYNNKIK
jgi:hypothetical protein